MYHKYVEVSTINHAVSLYIMLGAKITPEDRDRVVTIVKKLGNIKVYETWINDQLPDYCVYIQEYGE